MSHLKKNNIWQSQLAISAMLNYFSRQSNYFVCDQCCQLQGDRKDLEVQHLSLVLAIFY